MARERLIIQVDRVLVRKPDSGWSILRCTTQDAIPRPINAKGVVSWDVKIGDRLAMDGEWKQSRYNGAMEFEFAVARLDLPTDSKALLHYAISITDGLGAAKELEIWDAFGAAWRTTSRGLTGVKGISEKARSAWDQTLALLLDGEAKAAVIAWLLEHNCTDRCAELAWEEWGEDCQSQITANPHILTELPGYGFKWVDEFVRPSFGIEDGDPRRLDAAWLYAVESLTGENGDTVVGVTEAVRKVESFGFTDEQALEALNRLVAAEKIVNLNAPSGALVALARDFQHEELIAERLGVA